MNQQDKYGRAPLHVAAAVDYVEMVEFLVAKGADVNIRTHGEEQTPIHFAAKNDACKSLKALIAYGVDVSCRDYQDRTPLQVFRFLICWELLSIKMSMLHKTIFNDDSHRRGLLNQSKLVQLYFHCESSL